MAALHEAAAAGVRSTAPWFISAHSRDTQLSKHRVPHRDRVLLYSKNKELDNLTMLLLDIVQQRTLKAASITTNHQN